MTFKSVPIDVISAPNFFSPISSGRWDITSPNATTLWLVLTIEDSLGSRRYVPATGSTLQVVFQRSDLLSGTTPTLTSTQRHVSKTAVAQASDKSMFSLTMSSTDIQGIVSGSAKFTLTEGAITNTWVQNWMVKKILTDAGF